MTSFDTFNLPDAIRASLARMNFTTPTPIQVMAIPPAMEGKDILGSAQTGTGKTAAFSIPMVARLLASPRGSALVMTPTRELAVQVIDVINQLLGKYSTIKTALIIGGESMPKQVQALRQRPRIIVGTPGRINDHLERGTLMLHDAGFLVLDETDRMLDMGFEIQIDRIMKYMPVQRQTLLFSATLPDPIVRMSKKYLNNPERLAVGLSNAVVPKIQQELIRTTEANKHNDLMKELEKREGSIIVFVKTKWGAERLANKLRKLNHSADAIHGDLQQSRRERVISAFRDKRHRIMVATDIAARGLDIPHIEHVINYDLPQCPEDYIHRIGRTARAGAEGCAVSFITPQDDEKWRAINRLLNPNAAHTPSHGGGRRPEGKSDGNGGGKQPFRRNRNRNRSRHGNESRPAA